LFAKEATDLLRDRLVIDEPVIEDETLYREVIFGIMPEERLDVSPFDCGTDPASHPVHAIANVI
jgi:hypothetical protein